MKCPFDLGVCETCLGSVLETRESRARCPRCGHEWPLGEVSPCPRDGDVNLSPWLSLDIEACRSHAKAVENGVNSYSDDEVKRMQVAIDTGMVWGDINAGGTAMLLIGAHRCKTAPGVVSMWKEPDGRYRPIYSREEHKKLIAEALSGLETWAEKNRAARAEIEFQEKYRDELIALKKEELLTPAFLPWTERKVKAKFRARVNALRAKEGLPPLTKDP